MSKLTEVISLAGSKGNPPFEIMKTGDYLQIRFHGAQWQTAEFKRRYHFGNREYVLKRHRRWLFFGAFRYHLVVVNLMEVTSWVNNYRTKLQTYGCPRVYPLIPDALYQVGES